MKNEYYGAATKAGHHGAARYQIARFESTEKVQIALNRNAE